MQPLLYSIPHSLSIFIRLFLCLSHCISDGSKKLIIGLISRNVRIICLNLVCASEQESRLTGLDHTKVIVRITAGDSLKADGLQCLHCAELRLLGTLLPGSGVRM